MFFSPWPFFPCAGVWHFIIFVMQHITSRNWVQDRHENDFSLGYSYFKVYVYTNELVWLSVIICLFSNLYKRSLQASRLTSRKAFAFFVRVNYEHFLIFFSDSAGEHAPRAWKSALWEHACSRGSWYPPACSIWEKWRTARDLLTNVYVHSLRCNDSSPWKHVVAFQCITRS